MVVPVVKADKAAFTARYSAVTEAKSMFPPVAPLMGSPSRGLFRTCEVGALGTIQILVGLFNIGLGPGRTSTHPEDLTDLKAAYWLGAVYIMTGIVSLSADQCRSRCFAGFAAFMNITCTVFSVVGLVLYAVDLTNTSVLWMCNDEHLVTGYSESCRYVAFFAQRLLTAMDITLIILSILMLSVSVALSVLAFRPVIYRKKVDDVSRICVTEVVLPSPGV